METNELRCQSKLHGILITNNELEIVCNSRFCGAEKGVVVLHVFDLKNKKILNTKQFRNPIVGE